MSGGDTAFLLLPRYQRLLAEHLGDDPDKSGGITGQVLVLWITGVEVTVILIVLQGVKGAVPADQLLQVGAAPLGNLQRDMGKLHREPGQGQGEHLHGPLNADPQAQPAAVLETLERLEVADARVTVVDKGALDCTLKVRVECAVFRSCGQSAQNIPWGGVVR